MNLIENNLTVGTIFEEHVRLCKGKDCLEMTNRYSVGYELYEEFTYGFCNKVFKVNSGPKYNNNNKTWASS